jgi:gluconokinase
LTSQRYIIGVDIGTSSTRSVLFNFRGEAIGKHQIRYSLYAPVAGVAEQNPDVIFEAVIKTVRQVMLDSSIQPCELLCLSFSAAMHSLIAVDAQGGLLTQCITWADNRGAQWAKAIQRSPQRHTLYQRTGTPIHPMSPLVKILWLYHEHPEIFARTAKFISIKEYIFYRLFHRFVVDDSTASTTGLLNIQTRCWDPEALNIAHITEDHLSHLVPVTYVLQDLEPALAEAMGLLPTTPVVVGASDGPISNLGLGAIAPGVAAMTVGTSGAIRTTVPQPLTDPHERLFCYILDDHHWVVGGAVNNGGVLLQWLRDQLAIADHYEALLELAVTVPAGADGLIFHPYLLGERSPLWQPEARGSFFGLTLNHHKAHLVRAVLEGIALNLYKVFQVLQSLADPIRSIRAAGGFMANPVWRQIVSDVFNYELIIPEQHESSGLGAAILGLYALNVIDSLDVSCEWTADHSIFRPIAQNVAVYRRILPIYERLLDQFQGEYAPIAELQNDLSGNVTTILRQPEADEIFHH